MGVQGGPYSTVAVSPPTSTPRRPPRISSIFSIVAMASFRPLAMRSSRLRPFLQSRLELSSPSVRPSVPVLCPGARRLLSTSQLPSQLAHSLRRYSSKRPAASEDYDIEEEEVVSKSPGGTDGAPTPSPPPPSAYPAVIYVGPVSKAFRFLKCVFLNPLYDSLDSTR